MKSRLLVIIFLWCCQCVFSQTLTDTTKHSKYGLVYKISEEQAQVIYEKRSYDFLKEFNYDTPMDTIFYGNDIPKRSKSKKWKGKDIGHFVSVSFHEEELIYQYHQNSPFFTHVLTDHHQFLMKIISLDGTEITDAKVVVGTTEISFDPIKKAYQKDKVREGVVTIEYQGKRYFSYLIKDNKFYKVTECWKELTTKNLPKPKKSYGYLILNKPKYRHGDTVKVVGYLVKKNKEYGKKMFLSLEHGRNRWNSKKVVEFGEISPNEEGFYTYELVLGDSLILDKEYSLVLERGTKNALYLRKYFYLEDYQLQKNYYQVHHKKNYNKQDTISFYLEGKTINELPSLGTKAHLEVRLLSPQKIKSRGKIPFDVWEKDVTLDQFGQAEISFPMSIDQSIITYELVTTFVSSTNEIIQKVSTFEVNTIDNEKMEDLEIINDQILSPSQKVTNIVYKVQNAYGKIIKTEKVGLPYQFQEEKEGCEYYFYSLLDTVYRNRCESKITSNDQRTHDSLFFSLKNPRELLIHYTLFEGKKIIKTGEGFEFDWKQKINPKKNYSLVYNYVWNKSSQQKKINFYYQPHKLSLNIDAPTKAIFGEEIKVQVQVQNQEKEPVESVKVVSNGVNKKFQTNLNPSKNITKGTKYTGKNELKYKDDHGTFYLPNYELEEYLKDVMIPFQLDSIVYYPWRLAAKDLLLYHDTNTYDIAQLAPFIYDEGELQKVFAIWVDQQPVYFYPTSRNTQYAFEAPEGKHTIKIRTRKKLITIQEVELKKNHKLYIFFDLNKKEKSPLVTVQKQKNRLKKAELKELLSYCYQPNNRQVDISTVQNNTIHNHYYKSDWCGPLVKKQMVRIFNRQNNVLDTTFVFEGTDVGELKRRQRKNMKFSRKSYQKNDWNDLLVPFEQPIPTIYKPDFQFRKRDYRTYQSERLGALLISADDEEFILFQLKIVDTTFYVQGTDAHIVNLEAGVYDVTAYHKNGEMFQEKVNIEQGQLSHIYFKKGNSIPSDAKINSIATNYRLPRIRTRKKFTNKGLLKKTDEQKINDYQSSYSEFYRTPHTSIFEHIANGISDLEYLDWKFDQAHIGVNIQNPIYYNTSQKWQGIGGGYFGIFMLSYTEITLDYNYWGEENIHDGGLNIRWTPSFLIKRRRQRIALYVKAGYHHLWSNTNQQAITTALGLHLHLIRRCFFDIEYNHYHTFNQNDIGLITGGISIPITRLGSRILGLSPKMLRNLHKYWLGGWRIMCPKYRGGGRKNYNAEDHWKVPHIEAGNVAMPPLRTPRYRNENESNDLNQEEVSYVASKESIANLPARTSYIRSNFRDYTHLTYGVTNANGQYQYSYTLPDNVTTWNSYVLAMNRKGYQGYKTYQIQVYQSVMAQLSVPRFMLEGDTINVIGKAVNYTDEPKSIVSQFEVGEQKQENPYLLTKSLLDTYTLVGQNDTMSVTYTIQENNELIDGEKRDIPIYPIGVVENKGTFAVLKNDTSFTIPAKESTQTLYILDDLTETIIHEIEEIKKYPYYCNEQIASKIRVLLVQKELAKTQEKSFKEEYKIKKLIKRLVKNQHSNGSWGWFEKSSSNYFITGYVALTLQKLKAKGYEIQGLKKATQYLVNQFHFQTESGYKPYNTLYNLGTLSSLGNHQYTFDDIKPYTSSIYTQILRLKILQNQGKSIDVTKLLAQAKKSYFGALYWGNYESKWWDNSIQLNVWMYQLLKKQGGFDKECEQITNYFLEKHENTWRNTMESAQIVEILLAENEVSKEKSKVLVNGEEKALPYQQKIPKNEAISVKKEGRGKVFFTAYETFWNSTPKKVDSILTIQTHFEDQEGNRIEEVKVGQMVTLVAEIDLPKSGSYWMVNVTIPSSCTYYEKPTAKGSEVHREYFRDRVSVFYESLATGKYQIKIPLQVRFEGNVSLNPAKMEMMYFPTFYGRNEIKQVQSK